MATTEEASLSWSRMGEGAAFNPPVWEFMSRHYFWAARHLRANNPVDAGVVDEKTIGCLVAGQFNMALAVELIAKAYYLQAKLGDPENVYTHDVSKLLPHQMFTPEEIELFDFAFACVEWAGRYPTPKWHKEGSKRKWDVPVGEDGCIDGTKIPNAASPQKIDDLDALYSRLSQAYKQSGESK
jgi:hypothetical protein